MIIQCEKCKSRFRLNEKVLGDSGAKVRCSLCGHIFKAYPPTGTSPPPAEAPLSPEPAQGVPPPEEQDELWDAPDGAEEKDGQEIDSDNLIERGYADNEAHRMPSPAAPSEAFEESLQAVDETWGGDLVPPVEKQDRPRRRGRFWIILLLVLLLLGAAGAGLWFFAPQYLPSSLPFLHFMDSEKEDAGIRNLNLEGISGRFILSEKLGRIFAIDGNVVSNYPEKRSFILLRGNLLDERGQVVQTQEAYAGNPLREEELKTMSSEELAQAMANRDGIGRSNFNVEPGESIPFTIVFHNLPPNLSEFTVEPVQSSPGM